MASGKIPIQSNAVSLFVISEDFNEPKVLLLCRADTLVGLWCQIAGSVEGEEFAWQAALRELREETGLEANELYSADTYEQFYEADKNVISILPVFICFLSEALEITLNDEHSEYKWISFEVADEMLSFEGQRRILKHIKSEFIDRKPNKWLQIDIEKHN